MSQQAVADRSDIHENLHQSGRQTWPKPVEVGSIPKKQKIRYGSPLSLQD